LGKNKDFYKMMDRSEAAIAKRLAANGKIGKKGLPPDIELLEDRIIQLEKREEDLLNEIKQLTEVLYEEKRNSKYATGFKPWPTVDFESSSGISTQPSIRVR